MNDRKELDGNLIIVMSNDCLKVQWKRFGIIIFERFMTRIDGCTYRATGIVG